MCNRWLGCKNLISSETVQDYYRSQDSYHPSTIGEKEWRGFKPHLDPPPLPPQWGSGRDLEPKLASRPTYTPTVSDNMKTPTQPTMLSCWVIYIYMCVHTHVFLYVCIYIDVPLIDSMWIVCQYIMCSIWIHINTVYIIPSDPVNPGALSNCLCSKWNGSWLLAKWLEVHWDERIGHGCTLRMDI